MQSFPVDHTVQAQERREIDVVVSIAALKTKRAVIIDMDSANLTAVMHVITNHDGGCFVPFMTAE
jgi:hypothetical protein